MSLYALKPRFQGWLRPLVGCLARVGVTANQVTVIACAGSALCGLTVISFAEYRPIFFLMPLWLLVRMALNAIDGMLAREFGQRSPLGAYLNEICDVVSDASLYAPFALISPFGPIGIGIIIFLSALAEFAGVLGSSIGASRRYEGPLGKSDRALVFGGIGLLIGSGAQLPQWLSLGVPVLVLLLVLTVINRVRAGLAEFAQGAKKCS